MIIGEGKHTFPSRTRSLSPQPPMVVRPRCRARVGRCQNYWSAPSERKGRAFFFTYLKILLLLVVFLFLSHYRACGGNGLNRFFYRIHLSDKLRSGEPNGGIAQAGGDFQSPQNGRGRHVPGNSPAERFIIHFGFHYLLATGIKRPRVGISTTFLAARYSCNVSANSCCEPFFVSRLDWGKALKRSPP